MALVGAATVGVVASVLPWISVSGPGAPTVTTYLEAAGVGFNGLDRNGAATIVAFLAVIGLGVARLLGRLPKAAPLWAGALGLFVVGAVLAVLGDIDRLAEDYGDTMGPATLSAAAAFGWWASLLAGVAVMGFAALAWIRGAR